MALQQGPKKRLKAVADTIHTEERIAVDQEVQVAEVQKGSAVIQIMPLLRPEAAARFASGKTLGMTNAEAGRGGPNYKVFKKSYRENIESKPYVSFSVPELPESAPSTSKSKSDGRVRSGKPSELEKDTPVVVAPNKNKKAKMKTEPTDNSEDVAMVLTPPWPEPDEDQEMPSQNTGRSLSCTVLEKNFRTAVSTKKVPQQLPQTSEATLGHSNPRPKKVTVKDPFDDDVPPVAKRSRPRP